MLLSDILVRDVDFDKAKLILSNLCKQNDFKLDHSPQKGDERPKVEIKIDSVEQFSMIPIYQKDNMIILKYKDGNQEYSNQILEVVERNISGYRFFTPQDRFIKEIFMNHLKARPDKKTRKTIKIDAKAIFTSVEYEKIFSEEN